MELFPVLQNWLLLHKTKETTKRKSETGRTIVVITKNNNKGKK